MSHLALVLTPYITLHALIRHGMNEPCFSIREIDMKLLRSGSGKKQRSHTSATASATAILNEQAARVKARQLMLTYTTNLIEANKDEIRWLKDCNVLGKRAPKSSLMSATFLLQLLREQHKTTLAAHLHNALVSAKLGRWKNEQPLAISEAEAAAEAAAAAQEAAQAAAKAQEEASQYEEEEEEDEDAHQHASNGNSYHGAAAATSSTTTSETGYIRGRRTASSKRKPSKYLDADEDESEEDDEPKSKRRKRTKRAAGPTVSSSSSTATSTSSLNHTPMDTTTSNNHRRAPTMASKAVLMLNPKDRASYLSGGSSLGISFGSDRTPSCQVVGPDRCTIVGPYRGSGSARATHGIQLGSWYVEVKGSELAAQAMQQVEAQATNGSSSATSSLLDQDAPAHCRIGWSTSNSPLIGTKLLGHDEYSYAYGDRYGDKIHEGEAGEYGSSFAIFQMDPHEEKQAVPLRPGDTIGMLIELGGPIRASSGGGSPNEAASPTQNTGNRISFYKNGEYQGLAWSDLPMGHTWYPSVSLINGMAVTFNFQVNMNDAKPTQPITPEQLNTPGFTPTLTPTNSGGGGRQLSSSTRSSPSAAARSPSFTKSNQLQYPQTNQDSYSQPSPAATSHLSSPPYSQIRPQPSYPLSSQQQQQSHMEPRKHPQAQQNGRYPLPPTSSATATSSSRPSTSSTIPNFIPSNTSLAELQQLKENLHQQQLVLQQQQRIREQQARQAAASGFHDPSRLTQTYPLQQPSTSNHTSPQRLPQLLTPSASPEMDYSTPSRRHLRVPTSDDDPTTNHSSVPPSSGGGGGGGGIMQPSPSISPASFLLPLVSPAPSPLPHLVSNNHSSGPSYSLSTTPIPNVEEPQSTPLLYTNGLASEMII